MSFLLSAAISITFFSVVGIALSSDRVWNALFQHPTVTYLKAGEYGEFHKNKGSLWKEPLNAWSSLVYSVFGGITFLTGLSDLMYGNTDNIISSNPGFSLLYGLSCIYLGISSCLFHASHSETWRKADAGMTSGVMAAPLILAIFDRARPISIEGSTTMVALATMFQFSLTHGFLPYGSSDILLPTLVGCCWLLELHPRWGGPVDPSQQYSYWFQCAFGAIGGMLLRASDIIYTKGQLGTFNKIMAGYFVLLFILAHFLLSYDSWVVWVAFLAGCIVYKYPERGHVAWHFFSSFALFIWWYMYRVRPGDPILGPRSNDHMIITLVLFVVIKNAARRIFMTLPFQLEELKDRCLFILEHILFVYFGYHALVVLPGQEDSWLYNPILCWSEPTFPSDLFHLFYLIKTAAHVEDFIFAACKFIINLTPSAHSHSISLPTGNAGASVREDGNTSGSSHHNDTLSSSSSSSSSGAANRPNADTKMHIHHISTAILCVTSYFSGYVKIGSIIMFLHDVSDLPLDFLRLFTTLHYNSFIIVAFIATVLSWAYWRLFFFPFSVLTSVAFESKSRFDQSQCQPGSCSWTEVPERIPFLFLLFSLFVLHCIWFGELLKKGYKKLVQTKLSP